MSAGPPRIFDRKRIRRGRERNARRLREHDFLHRRVMADIVDRLETVTRDFPRALFYGAGGLTDMLTPACGVGWIAHGDLAQARLDGKRPALVFDEEHSPIAAESVDLIVSLLTLHGVNDLVGALTQHRTALKPDGLFIGALFGEDTLLQLKTALYASETEITGGVSARIPPFAGVRDLGAALQRAGFALPVADIDNIDVRYGEPLQLLKDLRGMGETGSLAARAAPLTRRLLAGALGRLAAGSGTIRFDVVFLTAWAPHGSQQKPLRPGSASHSLEQAINRKRD